MCHIPSDLIQCCMASPNLLFHVTFITLCEVERKDLIVSIYLISWEPGALSYAFPIITSIILYDNY